MYDINLKNSKKGYMIGLAFLSVGLFFFVILFLLTFSGMFKKNSLDSSVKAIGIDENCHRDDEGSYLCSPIYHYIVDGDEYTCTIDYSASHRVSENQNLVYYDSLNPSDCVTDYTVKPKIYMYFLCLFPVIFILIGFNETKKVYKRIKKAKYLAKRGTLIKNLKYQMVPTNITINNTPLYAISVEYTLPNGSIINLVGEPRYDKKEFDNDYLVDLLIDPMNPDNYYVDFNITRK